MLLAAALLSLPFWTRLSPLSIGASSAILTESRSEPDSGVLCPPSITSLSLESDSIVTDLSPSEVFGLLTKLPFGGEVLESDVTSVRRGDVDLVGVAAAASTRIDGAADFSAAGEFDVKLADGDTM